MANEEFVRLLRRAADAYEIKGVQWKPRAYRHAARGILGMGVSLENYYEEHGKKGLEEIPGVGSGIASHIVEYLKKGKVKKWEELFDEVPPGSTDLLNLQGIGPRTVEKLSEELDIKSIGDLEKAIKKEKLRELEGFGKKTEASLLKSIAVYRRGHERMLLDRAIPIAEELIEQIKGEKELKRIAYAGSLRRRKETIGDIDILAISSSPKKTMENFTSMDSVSRVLSSGKTKSSVLIKNEVQVDFRIVPEQSYAAALLYFTGNKQHNIALRKVALKKNYKLSEYGLFKKDGEKNLSLKSEEAIYRKLGFSYIPPELRTSRGELEASKKGSLPDLLREEDMKGDLHMHTKYSDGVASLEEMVAAAAEKGYSYIAITDHSPSDRVAHGLSPKRLKKQWKEIDKLAGKHKMKVLKGAEINIHKDGSLDYPDEILKKLNVRVCAVHSALGMPREEMTERICTALENEHLDILGHPSGRKLGEREACAIDFEKVFKCAADNEKVLEVNCQPLRLDLNDAHIFNGRKHGCLFSIDTDSHAT
ncbi:DNA polymerase/3'-5' exonuclease PolX, partial [Candidatus Micrarchaeota archaeon]|nr:DNA polymerase/3'-5' exonuclease PolX [Candidatus Micrarchaeota archaeon]